MKKIILHNFQEKQSFSISDPKIATIGFFDGLHQGHHNLLQILSQEAKQNHMKSLIITFNQKPFASNNHLLLMSREVHFQQITQYNLDYYIELQ
jgi:riboflavin kinase/FMN adenylyltransferase